MKTNRKKKTGFSLIKTLAVIATVGLTIGGVQLVRLKMEEQAQEQRKKEDKEYEISLAKALKNSYRDIKEIKLTNPYFGFPPGDWSCDVELTFVDGTNISYRLSHDLEDEKNYAASIGGPDADEQLDLLNSYRGVTEKKVMVHYSDKAKREE
ncbi:MAG: hypothetical protein Q4A90_05840 [Streptococcus sp.]|nr:hypothetical protein [Streptococcus sp.]